MPQPLQHDEAGVGQIRTIKSDNSSLSVKDNILGVAGRCISEQELVAVCKYLTTPFQASFCFNIEYKLNISLYYILFNYNANLSCLGQSKSLTFQDGVEAGTAGADGAEEETHKKIPEACCPGFIHK